MRCAVDGVATDARRCACPTPSETRRLARNEGFAGRMPSANWFPMKNPETRPFVLAWLVALLFYVLEYATRSSPAVMIPQLESAYSVSALGVSGIIGAYYYAYSISSLVAGAAIDRFGAKAAV